MKQRQCTHSAPENGRQGFTLFELIGVLAIISILLAMVAPITLDMLKLQRQQSDQAALPKIAAALKLAMLREQSFPSANTSSLKYWADMAARHGAGSANEVEYSDNQQTVARKLYLAGSAFDADSFYSIVSAADTANIAWLADFQDPAELRMLLLSTINPDLPLPTSLSDSEFNAIWDNWSNASGAPISSATFGLGAEWTGRASELNLQRIDLRDFLCTVIIENSVHAPNFYSGVALKTSFSLPDFGLPAGSTTTYLFDTLEVATFNLADARVVADFNSYNIVTVTVAGSGSSTDYAAVELNGATLLQPGRVIDEGEPAGIRITAASVTSSAVNPPNTYDYMVHTVSATSSVRGLIDLLDPETAQTHRLSGSAQSDDRTQERYFFKGQDLVLGLPWSFADVGSFSVRDNYNTLQFDGLSWHY